MAVLPITRRRSRPPCARRATQSLDRSARILESRSNAPSRGKSALAISRCRCLSCSVSVIRTQVSISDEIAFGVLRLVLSPGVRRNQSRDAFGLQLIDDLVSIALISL